ncbi:MAG TPA: LPD7 domain-containing protein [Xylella fastidiosa subsp. multiplex]
MATTTTSKDSNTDLRNRLRGEPDVTPEDTRSELLQDVQSKVLRNNLRNEPTVSPEDTYSELLAAKAKENRKAQESGSIVTRTTEEQTAAVDKALKEQLEDELRRRKAREQEQAGQGLNSVDVQQRTGKELERGDFIVPRRITKTYTEVDGKFYAKDSNRVMFEDKGEKLATSTTNKEAVADMVAYAKAKQWDSLKLSGSQEFRREAWLQAESQGIKTQGYTPKQTDLVALETLRQERSTNSITPLQERKTERQASTAAAPRHDMNKNQAAMHVEASKFIATNMQALQNQPNMADKSVEDLTKLAYWRGIVAEENKLQPKAVQDEAIARFDKQAADPQFLKRLNQETEPKIHDRTTERVQQRDTHEQSL